MVLRKSAVETHKIDLVLDELDRKILYHWDLDARQSASQLAKKVGSNKDTVNFRMKRLVEEGIVTSFFTELKGSKLGLSVFKVYMQFQNMNKEAEKEFMKHVRSMTNFAWAVSCSGRWDALFVFWGKSPYAFHSEFIKITNKFSKYILNKSVIFNINWFYYNRKWLLDEYKQPFAIKYGEEPESYMLDETDKEILKMLIHDARAPIIRIAKKLNQSSQNIINRIKKLERDGIIAKYSLGIDYEKIGYVFCKAFIYLHNVTQERLDELYQYCSDDPHIFALTTTLGSWDVELEFEVRNFEQMTEIMDKMRMKFSDIVTNYESVIINKQLTVNYIVE